MTEIILIILYVIFVGLMVELTARRWYEVRKIKFTLWNKALLFVLFPLIILATILIVAVAIFKERDKTK